MTDEDIPSRRRDLLTLLHGAVIAGMTRHSWLPVPTAGDDPGFAPELAFSRTAGPLFITLDS
ncbi:MAG TPA: hypothetical protein VK601_30675, partial [Kofleriaceae bacterium]|nr:hypothetical protein [Kofleriaceae bacterium]